MDIDLELDGVAELQEEINDVRDRFEETVVFEVGSNVEYGVILERGRGGIEAPEGSAIPIETEDGTIFRKSVEGHPPYPWFKPAVREFQANPQDFIEDHSGIQSIDQINSTEELVTSVAVALENRMKDNVNAQKAGDRSPGTHPQHPQRDSGNLSASIQAVRLS